MRAVKLQSSEDARDKFDVRSNVYANEEPINLKLSMFDGRNNSGQLLGKIPKRQSLNTLDSRLSKSSTFENKGAITIESQNRGLDSLEADTIIQHPSIQEEEPPKVKKQVTKLKKNQRAKITTFFNPSDPFFEQKKVKNKKV